jgi:glutamate N-acetyltransferase / amino-acid N-acetyltransferase
VSGGYDLPVSPLAPERFPDLPRVRGVRLATGSLGLYRGRVRDDLLVAVFPEGCTAAGVFTTSATRSADVDWCRSALKAGQGQARALVVNAGNSNAFTGAAGVAKNAATVAEVRGRLSCAETDVFVAATGVIGEPLPPGMVADGVRTVWPGLGSADWEAVANAIRTTDTFAKGSGAVTEVDGRAVHLAGVAKGSGMIAPNMATTLNYVFTDARIAAPALQALLARYCDVTFNCITVDSDTSTSDTLMLFATGEAGGALIEDPDDSRLEGFRHALHGLLEDLALQIVRDGEGASKLIQIDIEGASDAASARLAGAAIANSPLVKTAIAAGDANWGRIVMALGKSGAPLERDALRIWLGDHLVAEEGRRAATYSEAEASRNVAGQLVRIRAHLAAGDASARLWTCDFTDGYVKINGAYRS